MAMQVVQNSEIADPLQNVRIADNVRLKALWIKQKVENFKTQLTLIYSLRRKSFGEPSEMRARL